jgi:hypothetical protein
VIRNEDELRTAQTSLRKLEQFLVAARQSHPPEDYQRMAEPFLSELEERRCQILAYRDGNRA